MLLIDGHSMAFRAFYALPVEKFTTSTGQSTNAVYGFTSMMVKLFADERPTHVAVAWDRSEPTFRHEGYTEYKAGRDESPPEFAGQVELMQELLDLIGIRGVSVAGFEADDILATFATLAGEESVEVVIASGDRDAFQLVTDRCTVLYPGRTPADLARMTPDAVEAKYGVPPERYRDLAALVGEKSDNLPGIPGVGPKTAAKWIAKYGSIHGIVDHADEITGKAGENLRAHLGDVLRNYQLNRLLRDVATGFAVQDLTFGAFDQSGVNGLFDLLEFGAGLRDRLIAALDLVRGTETEIQASESAVAAGFPVDVATTEPGRLGAWLAEHATDDRRLGLAVEGTTDVEALAISDAAGGAVLVDPTRLTDEDESALATWLADPARRKAVHDAKGPMSALAGRGWTLAGLDTDTRLAAYLLTPGQRAYDLAELCQRFLGRELSEGSGDGQLALDISGDEEPGGAALAARARATVELAAELDAQLGRRGEAALLSDLELPLVSVLSAMERRGIAVDRDYLDGLESEFASAVRQAEQEAHQSVGRSFNLGSPKQLQGILFDELELPRTKKIKTGYTTDADALAWLAEQRPDVDLPVILLRHRDQTKLRTTVEGLVKTIGVDGRIHTTYNQTVAATGRLSSTDPNLQNIPVRTDAGRRIRRAFVAGEGYETLLTADYSQIELRIMAHLSQDDSLIAAFQSGHDFHTEAAARVFGIDREQVDAEARARIKGMNYGLAYGLSAFGLAQQLGVAPDEARTLMDDFFAEFGDVRDYLRAAVDRARQDGYTQTMLGRRRYLPDLTSTNRQRREMAERMALNAPIQGSAADVIKVAMLRVEGALRAADVRSRMLLQVHDELVLEVAPGELDTVSELVRREMAGAYDLRVPLAVSLGSGRDWESAAH
nr:DNA polymerase I [Spiractinospora alimapuensis]